MLFNRPLLGLPVAPKPVLALEFDFRLQPGEAMLFDEQDRFLGTFVMANTTPPLNTRRAVLSPEDYFSRMQPLRF